MQNTSGSYFWFLCKIKGFSFHFWLSSLDLEKKLYCDSFRTNTDHDGETRALVKYQFNILKNSCIRTNFFSTAFQLCVCFIDNVLILSICWTSLLLSLTFSIYLLHWTLVQTQLVILVLNNKFWITLLNNKLLLIQIQFQNWRNLKLPRMIYPDNLRFKTKEEDNEEKSNKSEH